MEDMYKPVELFSVELGRGLANDKEFMDKLYEKTEEMRDRHFKNYGIIVPKIKRYISEDLHPRGYRIAISETPFDEFILKKNFLAIDTGDVKKTIRGKKIKEPAFHLDALWISPKREKIARQAGYRVASPHTVLAVHLFELIEQNQSLIITTKYVNNLLKILKKENEILFEGFKSEFGSSYINTLKKVLQNLAKENFNIRDIKTILETMCDADLDHNIFSMTKRVRIAIAPQTIIPLCDENKKLNVIKFIPNNSDILNFKDEFLEKLAKLSPEQLKKTNIILIPDSLSQELRLDFEEMFSKKYFYIFSNSEINAAIKINPNINLEKIIIIGDSNSLKEVEENPICDEKLQREKVIEQIKNSDVIITNESENIAVGLHYDKELEESEILFADKNLDRIKEISSEYELIFIDACAPDLAKNLFNEYPQNHGVIMEEKSSESVAKIYANLKKKGLWNETLA